MPVGFHIASAWVDIRAEDRGLRSEVREAVEKAARGQSIKIPVKIDNRGLRNELTRAMRAASANQGVKIPVRIDSRGLRNELNRALRAATSGQGVTINRVNFNTRGLRSELNRAIRAAAAGQRVEVPVNLDRQGFTRDVRAMESTFQGSSRRMTHMARVVTASVALIPPAIAVGVHAIRTIGPAAAVAVSAFSALGTMVAAGIVGFQGFGTAVKKAMSPSTKNVKQLNKAIKDLAPSSQNFVRAIFGMRGAFKSLRLDVQQALFKGLASRMRAFGVDTLPSIRIGLGGMAMILNRMGKNAFDAVNSLGRMGRLRQMFGGLHLAMKPLVRVPAQFLRALVQLTIAATPLLRRMTQAVGRGADSMSRKLTQAFRSGRLQLAISQAGNKIVSFFRRIGNNPEWQQFVRNMKESGPQIAQALGKIAPAVLKIINALHPLIGLATKVATALAEIVNALPTGFITQVMKLIAAFLLFRKVVGAILAVRAALMGLGAAMAAVRAGSLGAGGALALLGGRAGRAGGRLGAFGRSARSAGSGMTFLGNMGRRTTGSITRTGGAVRAAGGRVGAFGRTTQVAGSRLPMFVGGLGRAGGAAGRAGGLIGRMGSRVAASRVGMAAAAGGSRLLTAALGPVGIAAGVASLAVGGINSAMTKTPPNVEKVTQSLMRFGRTGKVVGPGASVLGKNMNELGDAIGRVAHPGVASRIGDVSVKIASFGSNAAGLENAKNKIKSVDSALAGMVRSGHAGMAKKSFNAMANAARRNGTSLKKLKELFPQYQSELKKQKLAQQLAARSMGAYGKAALRIQGRLNANQQAFKGVKGSLEALNSASRGSIAGQIQFEQAIDQVRGASSQFRGSLKMVGGQLKLNNPRAQQAASLLFGLSDATSKAAEAKYRETGSWRAANKVYQRGRQALIKNAMQMGLTRAQAKKLAGQIMRIPNKKATIRIEDRQARKSLRGVIAAIKKTPNKKTVTVNSLTKVAEKKLKDMGFKVKRLPNGKVKVTAKTDKAKKQLGDIKRIKIGGKRVSVKVDKAKAVQQLQAFVRKVKASPKSKSVTMKVLDKRARSALRSLGFKIKRTPDGKFKVIANTGTANSKLGGVKRRIASIRSKTVTITVLTNFNQRTAQSAKKGIEAQIDMLKKRDGGIIKFARGGAIPRFAAGGSPSGFLKGPGTGTSDSILAAVSNGEYVVREKAVRMYGKDFFDAINTAKMPKFARKDGGLIPRFAAGGAVGAAASALGGASKPNKPSVSESKGGGASAILTAIDRTSPALKSAQSGFMAFKNIVDTAYKGINRSGTAFSARQRALSSQIGASQKLGWTTGMNNMVASTRLGFGNIARTTQQFGVRQGALMRNSGNQQLRAWSAWGTGMRNRTNATVNDMAKRTSVFGRQTQQRFVQTRSGTHKVWTNWRTGMQGRTKGAMDNMRKKVQQGGNQIEGKFRGSRSTTHKVWTNWRTGMQGRTDSAMDNMRKKVQTGGNQVENKFRGTRSQTHKTWTNWRTGMQGRTDSAMDNMRKKVNSGGNQVENKFRGIRSQTHKVWTNWRTGMQGRTDSAMDNMHKRTNRFRNQVPGTFKSASNAVGKAWNNVRPKLAAPIKYLTGKVINKGVVPAMNKVVSQLGGSSKLKRVSTGGFASGGFVSGPGSGTSDSIPARLSNGEYVIRASSVRKYGVGYLNQVNRGQAMPNSAPIRRAMGGLVGTARQAGRGMMNFAKGGLAALGGASKDKLEKMMGQYEHKDYEELANWIWKTAINPLVNRAPGGDMMDSLVEAASKTMRKNAVKWLEANIFPMGGAAVGFRPGPPWKPGDGRRVNWRGVTVNKRTAGMLNEADRRFKKGRINPTQGSYSTRVAASGSTHAGGGAVDMSPATDNLVWALRGSGFAAWRRRPSQGPWGPHIHAIAAGDPTASPAAKAQVRQFFNGMNGLGQPDLFGGGGGGGGRGVQRWRALAIRAMRMGGLKVTGYTIGRFLSLMRQESGGNPRAINGWDSNARAGNASRGLMQVIPTTFRANHVKGTSWNIFDPLANMAAAARYIKRRYGGRVPNSPYREGGLVVGPGGSTRDKIPALLSNGEFVMNARAVQKHGMNFMNQLNGGVSASMSKGGATPPGAKGVPRYLGPEYFVHANKFASGGPVGSTSSSSGTTYRIKKGDTLSEIAEKFNTTVSKLVDLNDIQNKHLIYAGDMLKITADSSETTTLYTIKWGDTLSEIAAKHGTTVDELMRLNTYIRDADLIFAGKTLRLPGSGTPGGGTTTPPVELPFDQLPPYVFPKFRTTKDDQFESDETKKALNQMVYIPWEEHLAGVTESQIVKNLSAQDNLESLISNIAELKETVRAAFKGDDKDVHQKDMIDRIHLATSELQKWQKQLDAGTAAFEAAQASVEELQSSFDGLKDSTIESIKSFASVTKIGQWGTNVNVLIGQLETDLAKSEDFANSIEQLKARGVNSEMIGQIVEAGITGGGLATAHTLLRASDADIARLNEIQDQINAVADRAGTAAAEGMYGAGLQAAKGLLAGMEAERAQIEAYMLKIAKAMELSIKQALGIQSPSRVFMKIGEMATLGMVEGMGGRVVDVIEASKAIATAATAGASTVSTPSASVPVPVGGGTHIGAIIVNVNGAHMDLSNPAERRRVAVALARDIKEEIRKDDRRRR